MICKTFEVRDAGTFIPVLAICFDPGCEADGDTYLLRRAGYGPGDTTIMLNLNSAEAHNNPYDWPSGTMQVAHIYIETHFRALPTGLVIDVEFIEGLTRSPKKSEREL